MMRPSAARGQSEVPGLVLDHLVLGAASLDQGIAYLRDRLGVELPFGGAHPRMGTHNCLTRVGQNVFLEIIAIDPQAEPPDRPRWFGLDGPRQQQSLAERPRLIAWVAGTRDLATALQAAPIDLGRPIEMTRGDLAWLIGIREDGTLPESGVLPTLIQWPTGPHPSHRMADLGIRLESLRLKHPDPGRIRSALAALGGDALAEVAAGPAPLIEAEFLSADGCRVTLT